MTAMVEARGLQKRYRDPKNKDGAIAVNGIDLTIDRGEIFSLLGPNGAGKTTLISMMSGLLTPTAGEVFISGKSLAREPMAAKKMIGVVPQEIALYVELTARQNLEFFGKMYGIYGAELARRCDEVLEFIGLKDRQHDPVDKYSGGMKRRVNIGVGLLHKPALVFMDEPTVGVDPQSRRSILDAVKALSQQGMTVVYTTHYMEEAEELSHRLGIIDRGQLIALGNQADLIERMGGKDSILVKVATPPEQVVEVVKKVMGIEQVLFEDDYLKILTGHGQDTLADVIKALNEASIRPRSIEVIEPNLETVFLALTGRALRD